jgi:glycerate kinase
VRVLICPDSFTGTLTAAEAAAAMAEGWRRTSPHDDLVLLPLSDGGPGFLDSVQAGRGGSRVPVTVSGPLGAQVAAEYLRDGRGTAWVESAAAAGLHLVPTGLRDPTRTTSLGVGQLLAAAADAGSRRIVLGVGGTGTCDGGAGLLAGLGATSDPAEALVRGGAGLAGLASVDLAPALDRMSGRVLEVATDVDVPLLGPRGAARGFAPQKGATKAQVEVLEEAMTHWADLLGRTEDGRSPAVALGAGAGGGMGAALIRLGARRVPGIATVLAAMDLDAALGGTDLVITGEGAFDWQSLRGKAVAGVAAAALDRAVPVLVLAGRVEVSRREWIGAGVAAAFPAAPDPGEDPAEGLARAAERAARTWARR